MGMLRAATVTAGAFLTATIALAVGDIPTMYVGSFPSLTGISGNTGISGITGTFKGTSLVIKGIGAVSGAVTGRYACSRPSPAQTNCNGFITKDDGTPFNRPIANTRHYLEITWSAGRPVAMTQHH
jgi:hypothetical protein